MSRRTVFQRYSLQILAGALFLSLCGCTKPTSPPMERFLLTGTVTDPSGLPMEGAKLSLWMEGGHLPEATATTDAQGHYRFERPIQAWNTFDLACEPRVPLEVVGLEASSTPFPRSTFRQGIDLKFTQENPGSLRVSALPGPEGIRQDGTPFHSALDICKPAPSVGPVRRIVAGRILPTGPSGNRAFVARLAAGSYSLRLSRWKDGDPAQGRGHLLDPVLEKEVGINAGAEAQWAPQWP